MRSRSRWRQSSSARASGCSPNSTDQRSNWSRSARSRRPASPTSATGSNRAAERPNAHGTQRGRGSRLRRSFGLNDASTVEGPPREPYPRLFLRFLRFGVLAWGGPVAQIAMIRRELVDEERWIGSSRFNRVLAVYQALPGPEAHELCVYFGHLAAGRFGGVLAGLGFMLPGFALMLVLAWAYVRFGINVAALAGVFAGLQAGVLALIVRGAITIGRHALTDPLLWAIGVGGFAATLAGTHFAVVLITAGLVAFLVRRGRSGEAAALAAAVTLLLAAVPALRQGEPILAAAGGDATTTPVGLDAILLAGLAAGLLTFGGAYTSI